MLVAHQRPAALDGDLLPALRRVAQLARPPALLHDGAHGLLVLCRVALIQKLDDARADGLRFGPPVDALGAKVPVPDAVFEVADDDGVPRRVEQRGLLADALLGALALRDVADDDGIELLVARPGLRDGGF